MSKTQRKGEAVVLLDKPFELGDPFKVYFSDAEQPVLFDPTRMPPQDFRVRLARVIEQLGFTPKIYSAQQMLDEIQKRDANLSFGINTGGGSTVVYRMLEVIIDHVHKNGSTTRSYVPHFAGSGGAFTFMATRHRNIGRKAQLALHAAVGDSGTIDCMDGIEEGVTVEQVVARRTAFLRERLHTFLGNLGSEPHVVGLREKIIADVFDNPQRSDYYFHFDIKLLQELHLAVVHYHLKTMASAFQRTTGLDPEQFPEIKRLFLERPAQAE